MAFLFILNKESRKKKKKEKKKSGKKKIAVTKNKDLRKIKNIVYICNAFSIREVRIE